MWTEDFLSGEGIRDDLSWNRFSSEALRLESPLSLVFVESTLSVDPLRLEEEKLLEQDELGL